MTGSPSRLHEAAHWYAELGYRVFPCAPGAKTPLTEHGHLDASCDPEQIDQWWQRRPNANVGIATEGLVVIDVDAGSTWLATDPDRSLELAVAPLSLTAGGGRHFVFRQPAGRAWRNTTSRLAERVDTRANGGYIVVPPSVLEGGKSYQWAESLALDDLPESLPEPPAWLGARLDALANGAPTSPRVASGADETNAIPRSQRNATLARLGGTMRRAGMSQSEILAALERVSSERCRPPLEQEEIQRISTSIARYQPDEVTVALVEDHFCQMFGDGQTFSEPRGVRYTRVTSKALNEEDYTLDYLIDGLLVRGQPGVIAGPKKTLKTNISIDLALSLSHAGLFLGRFNVPESVRVGVMSGESGAATIQETARRIALAKDWSLECFENVLWSFEVPQLGQPEHTAALREFIVEDELEVVILDPTYMMMLGLGENAGNLFVVGSFLKSLGDLAQETGCTPLLCHHLKKGIANPYEPAELENIAWAGFQEFVRQWLLLNRRVKYDPERGGHHELWMSVGGSAGHSGLWGVDIDEGTRQDEGGRYWDVVVCSAAEAYSTRADAECVTAADRKERQKESQRDRDRKTVLELFERFPEGETKNMLRDAAGFSGTRFGRVLAELLAEGRVEECKITKINGQEYPGFRRTRTHPDAVGQSGCPTGTSTHSDTLP